MTYSDLPKEILELMAKEAHYVAMIKQYGYSGEYYITKARYFRGEINKWFDANYNWARANKA